MADWVTAKSADGPRVAAWVLQEVGRPLEREYPTEARTFNKWKAGARADFYALDKFLTRFYRHVSELPDDLWFEERANLPTGRATDSRTSPRPRRPAQLTPKPCMTCGGTIPLVYPNGRKMEPKRYGAQKYCSKECGYEALRGQPKTRRPRVAA